MHKRNTRDRMQRGGGDRAEPIGFFHALTLEPWATPIGSLAVLADDRKAPRAPIAVSEAAALRTRHVRAR